MIKYLFLDLDGVCCNFVSAACRRHERDPDEVLATWTPGNWDIAAELGLTANQFWGPINEDASFWHGLDPYPWFDDLWQLANDVADTVVFATSPSKCPFAQQGKAQWLKDRGINPARGAMIGARKYLLAAPCRVLVDDSDDNINAFENHGGVGLLFPRLWNAHQATGDPMPFLRDRLTQIAEEGPPVEGSGPGIDTSPEQGAALP